MITAFGKVDLESVRAMGDASISGMVSADQFLQALQTYASAGYIKAEDMQIARNYIKEHGNGNYYINKKSDGIYILPTDLEGRDENEQKTTISFKACCIKGWQKFRRFLSHIFSKRR